MAESLPKLEEKVLIKTRHMGIIIGLVYLGDRLHFVKYGEGRDDNFFINNATHVFHPLSLGKLRSLSFGY